MNNKTIKDSHNTDGKECWCEAEVIHVKSDEYQKGYIDGHREMARTVNEWFADEFKSGADNLTAFADFIRGATKGDK